jgi:hypothetical protein
MNAILWTYAAYILISLGLTIWVAYTLKKNGRVFLVEAFGQNEALADSVNHLLVVGFYLINIGYITLTLKYGEEIETARAGVEVLSGKIGTVLVVLGLMHFFNLYVFHRIRRKALAAFHLPPVQPQGWVQQT